MILCTATGLLASLGKRKSTASSVAQSPTDSFPSVSQRDLKSSIWGVRNKMKEAKME
ncbi:hypothetical protein DPMN_149979 [Dreissena polymorpha]|uniref:Uncharacterized protein n=1 Tax=Dreissena polymorpha TaxID=45954 RepID=A0A9D4FEJ1_DREPO|nr:hypothetical protein DPMN_149979 [Dreissena polymorpha]